jgi:hypothetical protein
METHSYRALIFPPIVLSILVGLFYSFDVFEILLDGNRIALQETVAIRSSASHRIGDLSASQRSVGEVSSLTPAFAAPR